MLNLSYQGVQDVVLSNEATVSAAEAHGMLAGMLCVDGGIDHDRWLSAVFDEAKETLHAGDRAVLVELCNETRRLLAEVDFSFDLFLPDDDSSLSERAQALSEWCRGFLYGLVYEAASGEWLGECGEILRDLSDISQLDADAIGETDEEAYMEISEFVRVGVQLIRGEFQQQHQKPPSLH